MNAAPDSRVAAVRRFNRFYTTQIGLLKPAYLDSGLSLTQARVLYEIANRNGLTAKDLAEEFDLDAGYLSRILSMYARRGWIRRQASPDDARRQHLTLTPKGRAAYAPLETRSESTTRALLGRLPENAQSRLVAAMQTIERLLAPGKNETPNLLRPHRPGDIGWIISRHAAIYGREYGWDETFERVVAEIAAAFLKNFDPKREHCWIAERDGEFAGCVFLVRRPGQPKMCQLRLLLVEPSARGLGIGSRLVEECLRFARQCGYRQMMLWTHACLTAARAIYKKAGFRLTESEKKRNWGCDVVSEIWEIDL